MAAAPMGMMHIASLSDPTATAPSRRHGRGACAGPCAAGDDCSSLPRCGSDASTEPTQDEGAAASTRLTSRRELCCQVPGCGVDLSGASSYLKRYRVCIAHQRAPTVLLASGERRFCQQCGRFQPLEDFDANKRSCRERLSRHNARRRKGPGGGDDTTVSDEPSSTATATAATKPAGGKSGAAPRRVRAGRVAKRVAAAARSASVSGPSNSASLTASGSDATFQPSGSEASSAATSPSAPAPPPPAAAKRRPPRAAAARPPARAAASRDGTRSPSGSPESKPRAGVVLQLRRTPSAGPAADADAPMSDAPHHPALAALTTAAPVGRAAALPGAGPFLASSPLPSMSAALGSGPLPQFAANPASAPATAPAAQGPTGTPLALPNPFAAWLPPAAPAAPVGSPHAPAPAALGLEPAGFPALPSGAFGSVGLELSANADLAMALRALDDEVDGDAAPPLCAVPSVTAASAAAAAAAAAASCGPMVLDLSGAVPALVPAMRPPPGSACTLSDAPSACAFAPFGTLPGQPRPPSPNAVSSLLADQVLDSIVDSWAAAMEHDSSTPTMSNASPVPRSAPAGATGGWVPQQMPPPLPAASMDLSTPSAWLQQQQQQQQQQQDAAWSPAGWGQQMAPPQALALAHRPLQLDLRLGAPLPANAAPPAAACGFDGGHLQDIYAAATSAGLPALRTAIAACGMMPAGVVAAGYVPQ